MNLLTHWAERINRCIQGSKNYEHICSCEALLRNFRRRFTCNRGRIEAEALTVVFDIIRDRIREADKKMITPIELRYSDE